jgi:hypothetical protein
MYGEKRCEEASSDGIISIKEMLRSLLDVFQGNPPLPLSEYDPAYAMLKHSND